jgi:hypothetical protein
MTVKPIWREHNYDSHRAPYYCLLTREVAQRTKGQSPYLRYLCLCLSAALPVRQPATGRLACRTPVGATRCASGIATDSLIRAAFPAADISVLLPESLGGPKNVGTEKTTKAPEGTATGVTVGGAIGGALGVLVGIGRFLAWARSSQQARSWRDWRAWALEAP